MGRSAKVRKRVKKTAPSPTTQPTKTVAPPTSSVQSAKKRAGLKSKSKAKSTGGGHVLGGADYVTLLLDGRRKAAEEAVKLPASDSDHDP